MPATLSQTEDQIMTALRTFLLDLLPAPTPEIIQTQANRVAEPGGDSYIAMTPLDRIRLATNVETWDTDDADPSVISARHSTEFRVQLDLHGPRGSDWAQIIATSMQGSYAFNNMPDGVKPLYATDGRQVPFQNGEHQYENRWLMTIALQVAPIVSTAMQFAASLLPNVILVLGED